MPDKDAISTTPKPVVSAVKRLLRPLVRLMISKGMGLPTLTELLKEVYVDVAAHEFTNAGKKQTDSGISILTGVHRKDVKRLRGKRDKGPRAPRSVSIGAQIVARWVGSANTTDRKGHPLPLPRQAGAPGKPSFDALVAGISTDVRPRAVLDEWLRLGIAHLDKEERVVLNHFAFVPQKGLEEKAFYLGRNIHDHIAAASHNLLGEGNPQLERSVHYSALTPDSAAKLADAAQKAGMDALLEINRMALELAAEDNGKENATRRINFGLYFYKGATDSKRLQIDDESEDSGA